ncbi:MAG: hypothetical protein IJL67_06945 [Oscillospiraceae bacterium]|nr:hypothetical protein [Oscillospiraceae bacterium]
MFGLGIIGTVVFKAVLSAILAAAVIGAITYFTVKITVNVLKKYKQKKASKLVMANVGSMIKYIPDKDKRTYSFDDLEKIGKETVVAEYDEEKDELVQAQFANQYEKWDENIDAALKQNDGIIMIEG